MNTTTTSPAPPGGRKRHRVRTTAIGAVGVVAAVIVAAGVASGSSGGKPAPSHSPAAPAADAPPAPSNSPAADAPPAPSHASARPTATPSPTGTLRRTGNVALPDSKLTPGAVFRGVTLSQMCTPGWAQAHRDVPEQVRYAVFTEYGLPYRIHDGYEVDHLIPLELGGSNSIRNLWPENYRGFLNADDKDRLESYLRLSRVSLNFGWRSR